MPDTTPEQREVRSTHNWTRKTVAVWEEWRCGAYRAFKTSFHGDWHLADADGFVVFSDDSLQEVMKLAETRFLKEQTSGQS